MICPSNWGKTFQTVISFWGRTTRGPSRRKLGGRIRRSSCVWKVSAKFIRAIPTESWSGWCTDLLGCMAYMMDMIARFSAWRQLTFGALRRSGRPFTRTIDSTETSQQSNVTSIRYRIFYSQWGMKNHVRRWWAAHDTPEFGHSIIAGTMRRMHELAKRKGFPVCDHYTVG